MTVYKDPRSSSWYYRFQHHGQYFGECGFSSKVEAWMAEGRKRSDVGKAQAKEEKLTFCQGCAMFLEIQRKTVRNGSWKNDRTRINFLDQYLGRLFLTDIHPEQIENCLERILKERKGRNGGAMSEHTRNHYLALIRNIFNKLRKARVFRGDNPTSFLSMRKVPRARVRFLYPDEERVLSPLVAQDPIVWPSYFVALHTGMRASEVSNIRVKDISFVTGTIFVPNSKSHRSRHIPMSKDLAEYLYERVADKKPDDCVVAKVIPTYVSRLFKRICQRVGISNLQWHDLRHTFAQRLLNKGVPIYKVSKILGHSSVVVTEQHYGHLSWSDLKDAVDQIDGICTGKVSAVSANPFPTGSGKMVEEVDNQIRSHLGGVA